MKHVVSSLSAIFGCALFSGACAQTVELTAVDGVSRIKGRLISVRDNKYQVETSLGVVSLDVSGYNCEGTGCPVTLEDGVDATIAGPSEMADVMLPILAEGFAQDSELAAEAVGTDGLPLEDSFAFEARLGGGQEADSFSINFTDEDGESVSAIEVVESSGDAAFDLMSAGGADMILSVKSASPATRDKLLEAGHGDLWSLQQERILAVDGLTAIVNPNNAVAQLSLDQISAIMAGEISNWSQLGGTDHAIKLYTLAPASGYSKNISSLLLAPFGRDFASSSERVADSRAISRAVQNDPHGFGVVRFSSLRGAKPVAVENECGIVVEPNLFSMKSEEYALQNRVALYNVKDPGPVGQALVEYLDNPAVDDLVTKAGLVSLSVVPQTQARRRQFIRGALAQIDPNVSAEMLGAYVRDTMDTERMSTTFRFSSGSSDLDNKARRDLTRVVSFIRNKQPARIILAGFADAAGDFATNAELSKRRASQVLNELQSLSGPGGFGTTVVEVRGFGELAPVACNSTPKGRATNRRVEVWSE